MRGFGRDVAACATQQRRTRLGAGPYECCRHRIDDSQAAQQGFRRVAGACEVRAEQSEIVGVHGVDLRSEWWGANSLQNLPDRQVGRVGTEGCQGEGTTARTQ